MNFCGNRIFNFRVISQRTVSSQSRLLNLLKAENPEEIFSKAYIEQLFPSFAISERMHMNGYEEKEDMDNPFGTFSIFDPFIQFDETEPDRGAVLDEKREYSRFKRSVLSVFCCLIKLSFGQIRKLMYWIEVYTNSKRKSAIRKSQMN